MRLYREGQASLVALQRQLQNREKNLSELSAAIEAQEANNQRLEAQLATLTQNIRESDVLIAEQNQQIRAQLDQIERSKQERFNLLSRHTGQNADKHLALERLPHTFLTQYRLEAMRFATQ